MELEKIFEHKAEQKAEKGKNVRIILKFVRHGDRDLEGNLTDLGRQIVRGKPQEHGIRKGQFDAVKAIGSGAGPQDPNSKMPRSLETAHIYAQEIEGVDAFKTRLNKFLNYETIKTPPPYDHAKIYNSFIPENYEKLSDKEKLAIGLAAQEKTIEYIFSLNSSEAETYKKEVAGSFAILIEHYKKISKNIKNGSKILLPAGTHGGTMEFVLREALVFENKSGDMQVGFKNINEIGGAFDTADGYNVEIITDIQGNFEKLAVSFDNPERPHGEMYLDSENIKELAEFYKKLHPEIK